MPLQIWARPAMPDRARVNRAANSSSALRALIPSRERICARCRGHSVPLFRRRRRYAVAPAGALLTGLLATLGPASRLWRRYAEAPAAAAFCFKRVACQLRRPHALVRRANKSRIWMRTAVTGVARLCRQPDPGLCSARSAVACSSRALQPRPDAEGSVHPAAVLRCLSFRGF